MRLIVECMGERHEYRLGKGATVIGRDPSCNIAFADPSLSRRHLECTLEGDRILVRDLKTRNGTFLGSQRIEEARLPPGVPLRAGNVWLRFEAEEHEVALAAPAAPLKPLDDLESRVPAAENYEQDDEPTPSVDEATLMPEPAAPRPGPGGGTGDAARVIVRDNRWFLRDAETGSEVEIVPVQKGGAAPAAPQSAAAPEPGDAGAPLPARILRRDETVLAPRTATRAAGPGRFSAIMADPKRRMRALLIASVALVFLIAAGAILFDTPKKRPLLTRNAYYDLCDHAVELFRASPADPADAVKQLQILQKTPTEGNPKLAKILQEAFEADTGMRKDFQKGYLTALADWTEVQKSGESSDAARKLAQERREWIQSQGSDLDYLRVAREALKQGDYPMAMANAMSVDPKGQFAKEAAALSQEVTDALDKAAAAAVNHINWLQAAKDYRELLKVRPDLAAKLQPKIDECEQYEAQRVNVAKAKDLVSANKYAEARPLLNGIVPPSPYAADAAALLEQIGRSEMIKTADDLYKRGQGEQALDLLKKAGQGDSDAAKTIRNIMDLKTQADAALQAGHFPQAEGLWNQIVQKASERDNAYAQEARRNLNNLPALKKAYARKLVDQADNDRAQADAATSDPGLQSKLYKEARQRYEDAQKIDRGNKEAQTGLKKLAESAVKDYNRAGQLPRNTLDEVNLVILILQSVLDRLPSDDPTYLKANQDINEVRRVKAALEKQGGAKGP